MRSSSLTLLSLFALAAMGTSQAHALSEDNQTMNTAGGAPRFSDPDDKMPASSVYMQNGQAASGGVDPSSVRYDYDPSSGSYVPHRN